MDDAMLGQMASTRSAHRTRRNSNFVLWFLVLLVLFGLATWVDAWRSRLQAQASLPVKQAVVEDLGLTDLCLFTEARYTRNPSQTDLNTAFQDHPLSLEHFPSGSLIEPLQGMGGKP
jgi:hypothetical protein